MSQLWKFFCRECGPSDGPCKHYVQDETIRLLKEDLRFNRMALCEIIGKLDKVFSGILGEIEKLNRPRGLQIIFKGEDSMSTTAGGSSVFQEVPTPAGAQFPVGTTFTWTVDDTADITLTPSPSGTECTATCSATPTATSYNLTCTSSFTPPGASAPVSGTLNVPIVPAAPPTPTGLTISQVS
jgi:hypothetical protein